MPSGNWSFTYANEIEDHSAEAQAKKAAVAILVRYPQVADGEWFKNFSAYRNETSEIRTEIICAKPNAGGSSAQTSGTGGSSTQNSGTGGSSPQTSGTGDSSPQRSHAMKFMALPFWTFCVTFVSFFL